MTTPNPFACMAVLRNLLRGRPGDAHLKTLTEHRQYPQTLWALRWQGLITDSPPRLTTHGQLKAADAVRRIAHIPEPRK